jgi:enoyl-CoA hydratase/carnithine racemase
MSGAGRAYIVAGSFLFEDQAGKRGRMIRLAQDGPIARITLDRPQARNAMRLEDWKRLLSEARQAEQAGARILILSGAGGCFCAGADLTEFPALQADPARREEFRKNMDAAMFALTMSPMPVIAAIEGACYGAGVALAMACDIRIADPAARFAITPARMGIGYPQGDVSRLVGLVGRGQASRLLFTGATIDAAAAKTIGLIDGSGGRAEVEAVAQEILSCDGASIAMLKRDIRVAASGIADDPEQDRQFEDLFASPRLTEALSRRRTGALPAPKA